MERFLSRTPSETSSTSPSKAPPSPAKILLSPKHGLKSPLLKKKTLSASSTSSSAPSSPLTPKRRKASFNSPSTKIRVGKGVKLENAKFEPLKPQRVESAAETEEDVRIVHHPLPPALESEDVFKAGKRQIDFRLGNDKILYFDREEPEESAFEDGDEFKANDEDVLALRIASDLASNVVVALGDVRLDKDDAEKRLKTRREYEEKKAQGLIKVAKRRRKY